MKKYVLISMLITIFGCSSVKVSCDYDKQVDFASYKTFAFSEDALKLPVGELNVNRVLNAVASEMANKGLKTSETPYMIIDTHIRETGGYGNSYNHRGGWRYGYGGGFSTTQVSYDSYTEGTMFYVNEKVFIDAEYEFAWMSKSAYKDGLMNTFMGGVGFRF